MLLEQWTIGLCLLTFICAKNEVDTKPFYCYLYTIMIIMFIYVAVKLFFQDSIT
jgi:hypothetical protein